jgi:hypothetical protein
MCWVSQDISLKLLLKINFLGWQSGLTGGVPA